MSHMVAPESRSETDTQNKSWADDKSKFGYRMLQKMGWSEGKGLGANENGMVEHLRARKKTSNAGIGVDAATKSAWNVPAQVATDLNDVLTRLAASARVGNGVSASFSAQPSAKTSTLAKSRGYMGRRAAGKSVGTYSKEALREIFGGAPLQLLAPPPATADDKALARNTKSDEAAASDTRNVAQESPAVFADDGSGSRRLHKDTRKDRQRGHDQEVLDEGLRKKEKRFRKSQSKRPISGREEGHNRDVLSEDAGRKTDGLSLDVAPESGIQKHRLSKRRRKHV